MSQEIGHVGLGPWMDAAFGARDWDEALEASRGFVGAEHLVLVSQQAGRPPVANGSRNCDAGLMLRCLNLTAEIGASASGQRVLDNGALLRWIAQSCEGALRSARLTLFALGAARIDAAALASVAALVRSAFEARARIDAMRAASALKASALDQLPFGVAIVDQNLVIEEMNAACRAIVRRGDGLCVHQGRFTCRTQHDQTELGRTVRGAVSAAANIDNIVRVMRAGGAQPYVLRPIGPVEPRAANCLLMIVDPDGAAPSAARIWRAMFDLTDCELIIAAGMVAGRRIVDIAHERGVSIETVRTQTKRMFERLNVSSQAEAAARLSRAAPFGDLALAS